MSPPQFTPSQNGFPEFIIAHKDIPRRKALNSENFALWTSLDFSSDFKYLVRFFAQARQAPTGMIIVGEIRSLRTYNV